MSITVKKVALPEQEPSNSANKPMHEHDLGILDSVQVNCQVRLGTLNLSIGELRQMKAGEHFTLHQKTYEPVDILLNDHVIARGDLMCCDDHFAIQITEMCT